jgi:thiamine kinase-like enzyme
LALGEVITEPTEVMDGLVNKMWYIKTSKGEYAIKELNKNNLKDQKAVDYYEITEKIARIFAGQQIPTVSAIMHNGKSLTEIAGVYYIAYPWINGKTLAKDYVSHNHAIVIARVLAKMHSLNLQLAEVTEPNFDIHSNSELEDLIKQAYDKELPFASSLTDEIFAWNDSYHRAILGLNKHLLISHGDLDQKNVMWQDDIIPILIDWEAARLLNPTQEIVTACLDWSGINGDNFNIGLFETMFREYFKVGGVISTNIKEAFYGNVGNIINWLCYNVKRSMSEVKEEREFAIHHVPEILNSLKTVTQNIDSLTARIEKI